MTRGDDPAVASRAAAPVAAEIGLAAFEQSPVSMVVYDARGGLLALNPAFERLWGVRMADAPPGYSILHDEQLARQGVMPLIERAFAGEAVTLPPVRYDIAAVSPSGRGRTLWTQAHMYALRDESGRVERVVLTHEDVTARLETERELRASEARFRAAVQATNDIIWTNDPDGRMLGEQRDWSEFTGQTRAEYEDYGWSAAVHPDDAGPTIEAWSRAVAERKMFVFEHRVRRRDGVYRTFAIRAVPVVADDGSVREWVGVHRDVTEERERTADAVRAREVAERAAARAAVLQHVTAALAGATTVAAVTDVIVARALPTLGASVGMLATVSEDGEHLELVSATHIPADIAADFRHYPLSVEGPLAEVARTGRPIVLRSREEMLARFPTRATLWERFGAQTAYVAPVVRAGRTLGALMFMWPRQATLDVDVQAFVGVLCDQCALAVERATLLEAEHRARAAAEAANASKSDFLSKMSHELRTPLNAVGGYVDLLDLGIRGPVTEQQRSDFARIRRAQRYLLSLINDLLNFTRLDAGQVELRTADVELSALFDDLDALVGAQLRAKGIEYERAPGDAPVVRADSERVRQVLVNVLSNALKFTPPGGRVSLSCEDGPLVRIHVRDTGRGIPADRLESVFEPFVQIDRQLTHDSQQGVGLGLAISRELARAMGGELSATSVEGAGSVFTLALPRA